MSILFSIKNIGDFWEFVDHASRTLLENEGIWDVEEAEQILLRYDKVLVRHEGVYYSFHRPLDEEETRWAVKYDNALKDRLGIK